MVAKGNIMEIVQRLSEVKETLDSLHNGLLVVDKAGNIVMTNKAASRICGEASENLVGESLRNRLPGLYPDFVDMMETGKQKSYRKVALGDSVVIMHQTPIHQDGNITGGVGILQDVSEQERIFAELKNYQKLNEELDAIINTSFDGFWICDHEGRVVRINQASEEISGVKIEEVIGKKMEVLVREGLVNSSVTLEVIKNKRVVTLVQKQKTGKLVLSTGSPLFDNKGNLRLVVVNERDLTELHRLRQDLEESERLIDRYRSEISASLDLKKPLSEIVIRSKKMETVFDTVIRVAKVDSTVMIQGESGVGKSLFAKLIHQASERRDGLFVRVDCAAIPESLIESELFGYEPGAFSGALTKGKSGLFQMADNGTLFLDEVGDIPLNLQVKLLRFLEDKTVVRVGGTTTKNINTRVIAATNRDLEDMIKNGSFRKDLFFRLNVVPIMIPSLKERTEELPHLISFFLEKFNDACRSRKKLSPLAIERLCSYSFPGNIRELANLLERLVVLSLNDTIDETELPAYVQSTQFGSEVMLPSANNWNMPQAVARLEKEMITRAVKTFGSQRKAAKQLGIDQSTLARKRQRYNLKV